MKSVFNFFIFFILMASVQAKDIFTSQEKEWMRQNPEINFVGDPDWLPFEGYSYAGKYVGIVPDLLSLLESRTDLRFKIIKTSSWEESLLKMKNKEAIVISQSQDSNKETGFLFTKSYYENPIVIIMAQKEKFVSSLHAIDNKRIAIVKTEPYVEKIQKAYPHIKFILVDSINVGLRTVSSGENDAFVHTLAQASYLMSKLQINNLRIVGKTEFNTNLGFGVSKDNEILVEILNKALSSIQPFEAYEILSKWIRQKYVEKPDYKSLYISIAVFTLIFLMGSVFYIRLKHESAKRIKAQQEALEHQSRMAAMGEMMDSVAHQWKQPLNALSMYGDLLKSDYKDGVVDQKYVDEMLEGIHTQIEHMINTLSEFRSFFRPDKKVQEVNLLRAINSVLILVKDELIKNAIEVNIDIDKDINVLLIENEFKHVILNIINNAKDAFNENMILSREITIQVKTVDENIQISICDNAGGIPKFIIDDIFKANVTSKEDSKGTGIGLYMSSQIIEKSGGSISAYNKDKGACFILEFPSKN